MSMIAHSSSSRFSIGVPGHREHAPRAEPAQSARPLGGGVLHVLRLVEDSRSHVDRRERIDVAGGDVVRGDDDVARAATLASSSPVSRSPPWWTWTRSDGANRSTSRAHWRVTLIGQTTRVGPNASAPNCSRSESEHRDRLHRLAEPHVVGEDRADPEVAEQAEPAVAALLEREQRMVIAVGVADGWKRRSSPPASSVAERSSSDDLAELEPGILELDARDGPDEIDDDPSRRRSRKRSARSTSERRSACQRPRTRISGSLAAASSASSSSVRVVSPIASCQSKRARVSRRQQPARAAQRCSWR